MANAEKLASAFAYALLVDIGPAALREVIRKNKTPEYAGCCASHDYCDANMTMLHAFEETCGRAPRLQSDADVHLMNEAWDRAKASSFAV
jgi:hypothetical protein